MWSWDAKNHATVSDDAWYLATALAGKVKQLSARFHFYLLNRHLNSSFWIHIGHDPSSSGFES